MQLSNIHRSCDLCRGRGLIRQGALCPGCEGAGRFPQQRLMRSTPAEHAATYEAASCSRLFVATMVPASRRTGAAAVTGMRRWASTPLNPGVVAPSRHVAFDCQEQEP